MKCVLWLLWGVRAPLILRNRICLSAVSERTEFGGILGYAKGVVIPATDCSGARAPGRTKPYPASCLCICFSRPWWDIATHSSQDAFSMWVTQVRLPFLPLVSVSKIHGSNSRGVGLTEVLRENPFHRRRHLEEATPIDIYVPNNVNHLLHASANVYKSCSGVETASQLALRNLPLSPQACHCISCMIWQA